MPEPIDHVVYLSQEVGARPAGTEEEQQAALYITEQMQKEAGLSAAIEDFNSSPTPDMPQTICYFCSLVSAILALLVPVLGIASVIFSILAAILFVAEAFDRPLLSKMLLRGVSQNVVAKYEPSYSAKRDTSRRRKIVLVSRYDSGKVYAELKEPFLSVLPILQQATFVSMVALPVFLLFRNIIFFNVSRVLTIIFNVFIIAAALIIAVALAINVAHKFAAYNEGANSNAAGVAVLLEVAKRLGNACPDDVDMSSTGKVIIHGEAAIRAAAFIPEGTEVVYEKEMPTPPAIAPQSPEERLSAAKAAIAAITGKPMAGMVASDISHNLVQVKSSLSQEMSSQLADKDNIAAGVAEQVGPAGQVDVAGQAGPAEQVGVAGQVGPAGQVGSSYHENITDKSPEPSFGADQEAFFSTETEGPLLAGAEPTASEPDFDEADKSSYIPDWFRAAQKKARVPQTNKKPVQRSRYASALEALETASRFTQEAGESNTARRKLSTDELGTSLDGDSLPTQYSSGFARDMSSPLQKHIAADRLKTSEGSKTSDKETAPQAHSSEKPQISQADVGTSVSAAAAPDATCAMDAVVCAEDVRKEWESNASAASASAASASAASPIVLPDIGISATSPFPPVPVVEFGKQRAPLADAESSGKVAAKSLLTMLPSIDIAKEGDASSAQGISPTGSLGSKKQAPSLDLPSLSAVASRPKGADNTDNKDSSVKVAGAFVPASVTGTFAPVGEELLADLDPDDIYVDDVDDSDYDVHFTETGAFAGPGYVEMPKSHMQRLFGRFGRKKKEDMPSTQTWLDVDETFDARTVGAQRGGWESFREDDIDQKDAPDIDRGDTPSQDEHWSGGAFSVRRAKNFDSCQSEAPDENVSEMSLVNKEVPKASNEEALKMTAQQEADLAEISGEVQKIYQFRASDITCEVWFVALGSQLSQNGGMRAFLAEHQQDLRGAFIIDLDSVGAGELSIVGEEGKYKPIKTSSRMKRYIRKASQATGLAVKDVNLAWEDSAASFALRHGYQAMHLVGVQGSKPAYFAQKDDVVANVKKEKLTEGADFVVELLKNI